MPKPVSKRRNLVVLVAGIAVIAALLLLRPALQQAFMIRVALAEDSVTTELVEELLAADSAPLALAERFWVTGKIPHRVALLRAMTRGTLGETMSEVPPWLREAALDADFQVRELALGSLVSHDAAAAEPFVRAALLDADPDIKELALRHARLQKMTNLMADVSALLDHPELTVNVAVAQTLRNWTGVDFGVRLSTLGLEGEGAEETEEGIGRWRAWRDENRADWQDLAPVAAAERSVPLLEAPDFELPTLKGEPVRLSQLRGRPVLINFWATWCSSCWPEIPELVALQNRAGERLTILGISLDGLPDQHAIDHGHSHHGHGEEGDPGDANAHGMSDLRKLVGGFAESKGMNYPVLLDPEGRVSMRYQGNELPVNVLIDAEGRVVRRFIGGRSANAFDDMILASLPDSKTSVAGPTP